MIICHLIKIHLFIEGAIKLNQPAINNIPPIGVIGPKKFKSTFINISVTSK